MRCSHSRPRDTPPSKLAVGMVVVAAVEVVVVVVRWEEALGMVTAVVAGSEGRAEE